MANEMVSDALLTILVYYVGQMLVILFCICHCIRKTLQNGPKGDKYGHLTVILVVFGIFNLFSSVIPFIREYTAQDVAVIQGEYEKPEGYRSKSHSGQIGMETVTITSDDRELQLTTYPMNDGEFPVGTYYVTAYYTPNTEFLLYIDFLDPSNGE